MSTAAPSIDLTLKALADPTRRRVVERLSRGPAGGVSVSVLAEPFGMALPSFMQHLKVLEASGLVKSAKVGRVRTFELVPKRLEATENWLSKQRSLWERRLDQLDEYLLSMKKEQEGGSTRAE